MLQELRLVTVILLLFPAGFCQAGEKPSQLASSQNKPPPPVIDINEASAEDFAKLPGIGPELARRIVTYREKHGPFRRVEDLLAIRGIGHKKWRAIRPYLKVGHAPNRDRARVVVNAPDRSS